jgi:hypothetical protein
MTNINNFAESYQEFERAQHEAMKVNKAAVFDALLAAGIVTVVADFDGEGDSGQITHLAASSGKNEIEIPDLPVTTQHAGWGTETKESRQLPLREAIEEICYGCLSIRHGGWENNDGAFGEITFDVPSRRIELHFNARFSDFVTFCDTL